MSFEMALGIIALVMVSVLMVVGVRAILSLIDKLKGPWDGRG